MGSSAAFWFLLIYSLSWDVQSGDGGGHSGVVSTEFHTYL